MLGASDVEVDALPVLIGLFADQCCVVVGVHIAQVVGAGACEARHGVELEGEDGLLIDGGTVDDQSVDGIPGPHLGASQWRLAGLGGLVFVDLRQFEGQLVLGNHIRHAVFIVDGERLAPVALAREDGVAQTVVHLDAAQLFLRDIFLGLLDGLLHGQSVERELTVRAVHHDAFLGVEALLADVGTLDEGDDGQVEVLGEGIVARVVGRHSHDGASAIAGQYIFGNPDGDVLARERIDGVRAREDTRHTVVHLALALGAFLHISQVFVDGRPLLGSGQLVDELALRSQHHEGDAEDGVGTGGEDGERVGALSYPIGALGNLKLHLGTLGTAYPVALGLFQRVGPLDVVQSVE